MNFIDIWALTPDDPFRQKLRTAYFDATGNYGSEEEIKTWYEAEDMASILFPPEEEQDIDNA